jgi:hypothetical protein
VDIIYPAMVANSSTISYLCFDANGQRIYRGEGTLNFICHTPYKRSKHKAVEELERFRAAATLIDSDSTETPSG